MLEKLGYGPEGLLASESIVFFAPHFFVLCMATCLLCVPRHVSEIWNHAREQSPSLCEEDIFFFLFFFVGLAFR